MEQLLLALLLVLSANCQGCEKTNVQIGDLQYNLNHLKNHLPPHQKYKDRSNIYAANPDSSSEFIFFNVNDVVKSQEADKRKVTANCSPRSYGRGDSTTTTPVACMPETKQEENCPENRPCWVALGSCKSVTPSLIDDKQPDKGINLLYTEGDIKDSTFVVQIHCCDSGACLDPTGLESPAVYRTSGCVLGAGYCVEITSPYGCDCEKRALIDTRLGKKEFHCDAIPSGLSGGTSTGTYLVIFFFVLVLLYLAIGMGYNYSEGRRGEEMLPQLDMWKDLGGLVYDGFMYIKTCGEYREGVQYDYIG